jgi:hypothetical protein
MAYNPFDFFRKNQKVFFAGLTVVVMFMFVLSFGQGDFFSWFPQWLSAQKSYGEVMAVIDGDKLRESDLSKVNAKRNLANQYMLAAAEQQRTAVNKQYFDLQAKVSQETAQVIGRTGQMINLMMQIVQPRTEEDALELQRRLILGARAELAQYLNRPELKPDDKTAVEGAIKRLNADLQMQERLVAAGGKRGEANVYFAAMPNRNMRDQLEYLLWLKKADQLGIRFTPEDVRRLVDVEFPDVPPSDLDTLRGETLRSGARRRTEADLADALADEFRVRAAQTAVLGVPDVRFHGGLQPAVPYDLYEFYKKQTSPTQYTFLKVPTDAFLPLVQGEPTDAELKKIFADTRLVEPDPANPKFGIKEPRKIKVQWAEVTGSEPYYDGPSEAKLKQLVAARTAAATPAAAVVLGAAATQPAAFNDTKYDEYLQTQANIARLWGEARSNPGKPRLNLEPIAAAVGGAVLGDPAHDSRRPGRPLTDPSAKLADASLARPQTVGVLAAVFGGSFATGGSLLSAPVLATEAGYRAEHERRLLAGIQGFVLPTLPGGPAVLEQLAGEFSIQAALPPPLPKAVVQPLLDQVTKAELRYQVASDDVKAFQTKLADIMKNTDKAAATKEAAEYTAKFIQDRGLKAGASTDLRDIHTIADDPGVAALIPKSGATDAKLGILSNPALKSGFGATLFFRPRPPQSQAELQRPVFEQTSGVYAPAAYPPTQFATVSVGEGSPLTLVWRTEETRAESPREFGAAGVREKCVQVWKRQKARELARQAVDAAVAKVKEAGESGPVVNLKLQDALAGIQAKFTNPADKAQFRLIDDPKYTVAKLVRDPNERFPTMGGEVRLQPFSLTNFRGSDDFVYPTENMNNELLANRDKPVGTAVVLADAPETTLYVAALTSKDTASPFAFRETIYRKPKGPDGFDLPGAKGLVEGRYSVDSRKAERDLAVSLLKAEFGYANENPDLDKKASDSGE